MSRVSEDFLPRSLLAWDLRSFLAAPFGLGVTRLPGWMPCLARQVAAPTAKLSPTFGDTPRQARAHELSNCTGPSQAPSAVSRSRHHLCFLLLNLRGQASDFGTLGSTPNNWKGHESPVASVHRCWRAACDVQSAIVVKPRTITTACSDGLSRRRTGLQPWVQPGKRLVLDCARSTREQCLMGASSDLLLRYTGNLR